MTYFFVSYFVVRNFVDSFGYRHVSRGFGNVAVEGSPIDFQHLVNTEGWEGDHKVATPEDPESCSRQVTVLSWVPISKAEYDSFKGSLQWLS